MVRPASMTAGCQEVVCPVGSRSLGNAPVAAPDPEPGTSGIPVVPLEAGGLPGIWEFASLLPAAGACTGGLAAGACRSTAPALGMSGIGLSAGGWVGTGPAAGSSAGGLTACGGALIGIIHAVPVVVGGEICR